MTSVVAFTRPKTTREFYLLRGLGSTRGRAADAFRYEERWERARLHYCYNCEEIRDVCAGAVNYTPGAS